MSFKNQIANFNKKTRNAVDLVYRGTVFDIFRLIIIRTPVDTGRLRGAWNATINQPAWDIPDTDSESFKTVREAIQTVQRTTSILKITESAWLMNNLPYAEVIEDGSSNQAPGGMVKITVAEFRQHLEKNARTHKK